MKKIIIVGMGFMGVTHARNVLANPNLELCGIVDNRGKDVFEGMGNLGNIGEMAVPSARLKATPVFTSLSECIRQICPNAAVICTPLFLHYEMTKQCLEMGLDVLVEKPFCSDVSQGYELIQLAERKQRILMVAQCIRFAPEWEFLAQCIRDERYGKICWLKMTRMGGEPTWGVWQNPEIKKTCGGSLLDLLIHDIDFANYCFGVPTGVNVHLNCDEYWELQVDYDIRPACTVSVTGGFLHRNGIFTSEYVANFERASLRYCTLQPGVVHIGTNDGPQTISINGDLYAEELRYFAACVLTRELPLRCLPADSLRAIEICRNVQTKKK